MNMYGIGCLALLITLSPYAKGNSPDSASPVFQDGEVLQYKVKWTIFRLGTLTLRTIRDSTCTIPTDYKIALYVESNPDISIIWIRGYFESLMDAILLDSKRFWALERNGEKLNESLKIFDKEKKRVMFKVVDRNTGNTIEADTIQNVSSCVEGPSLFFYSRAVCHSIGFREASTFVDGRMGTTELTFRGEKGEVEIENLEEPVRARVFTGQTKWGGGTAVAGLEGDFTGWFSDDEAAVPLRAEMKIIVGSIVIELEEWTRAGWVPPTGRIETDTGQAH
jgi:hypothetical protein